MCLLYVHCLFLTVFRFGAGELLLDPVAENNTGIVGAERIEMPVRRGIVDDAAFDAFHIVIVGIHEMHAGYHERFVGVGAVILAAAGLLVEQSLDGLPELGQRQPFGSLALVEMLVGAAEQAELAEVVV